MVKFDHTQEIRAAQVNLLYRQLPSALLATIVNAFILVAVLRNEVSQAFLIVWLLVVLLVASGRYAQRRAYLLRSSATVESPRWRDRHLYGVVANGVLWGIAGFFFFTSHSYIHQVFLAFVLMGMVSGSVSTLSPVRGAYLVFLLPALSPYAVRLLRYGDELHLAMAGMLILYVTMMAMIGHRLNVSVADSLRLRFDNLDLLDDLTLAKQRQELANQELAAQVAEKHSAQDALQKAYAELETRVEERTAELAKSEEALRGADRRKDEFLAMLGHELRNPLAPIRNAAYVMHQTESDATLKWAREIIIRQVDHLTRLVDDLLDVSRIVYGKITLQETNVDIATVINQAVEGTRPFIDDRHQKLLIRLPKEPLWVKGDLVRLDQVVSNLLNNAAKYSDIGGSIRLGVEASEHWITIRVQDDGIGMPPEVLSHVFQLFAQARHSLARTQGGLGIGLTLVKRLVEMHGGEVEAHSRGAGHGSEFLVRLPRQPAPFQTEIRTQRRPVIGSEEPIRVLVVDDNRDAADTLAFLMRLEGRIVAVAYDGVTALAEAAHFQPQVVLLDIGMPGMDGYEVARKLRAGEPARSIAIIAMTGYGQPEDRARSEAAGFTDHLAKPIDPELLNTTLKARLTSLQERSNVDGPR
jgi:signal transduction histidine kinase/ActR/RegA family two-component response regulator